MRGLRIRFSRHGIRNQPLYHIVVLDQSKAQRALPLEKLGEYDPVPQVPSVQDLPSSSFVFGKAEQEQRVSKERKLSWNVERMKYWLKQGAQPTGAVAKLMEIGGLLDGAHGYRRSMNAQRLRSRLVTTTSDTPLSVALQPKAVEATNAPKSPAKTKRSSTRRT